METIGGGIVRFVGVELLPCPEDPRFVGQCVRGGVVEVWLRGRADERFAVDAGDVLLVADGDEVAPETLLVSRPYERAIRANLPAGGEALARWGEALREGVDEVTGLSNLAFAPGASPMRVELRDVIDDRCLAVHEVARDRARPAVADGAVVRRGDRLAVVMMRSTVTRMCRAFPALRALLDVRPIHGDTLCLWRRPSPLTVKVAASSQITRSASLPAASTPLSSPQSAAVLRADHCMTFATSMPRALAKVHSALRPSCNDAMPPHACRKSPCFSAGVHGE